MVEIIKQLKKILKGVSALQGVVFNHHIRHEKDGGDEINVEGLSGDLADLQHPFLTQGTHANRPAPGTTGRLYYETDTGICFRDNGTAWEERWRLETKTRLAQLAEKLHSSLTGVTSSQHHTKTTDASELTSGLLALARLPTNLTGKNADKVDGHNIFVQSSAPNAEATNDIWIDT